MSHSAKALRVIVCGLALATAAGCAQQSAPPAASTSDSSPELAGAWYQIYFDTNSSAIDARGQGVVNTVAYVVANAGPTRVTVLGRTDRVGAPPANMALSQRRADTVRDALIAAGVPSARIDTIWTGEVKQDVTTADNTAEQRNRVVDITVVKLSR